MLTGPFAGGLDSVADLEHGGTIDTTDSTVIDVPPEGGDAAIALAFGLSVDVHPTEHVRDD